MMYHATGVVSIIDIDWLSPPRWSQTMSGTAARQLWLGDTWWVLRSQYHGTQCNQERKVYHPNKFDSCKAIASDACTMTIWHSLAFCPPHTQNQTRSDQRCCGDLLAELLWPTCTGACTSLCEMSRWRALSMIFTTGKQITQHTHAVTQGYYPWYGITVSIFVSWEGRCPCDWSSSRGTLGTVACGVVLVFL